MKTVTKVTPAVLAKLANERRLPQIFEKEWHNRSAVNPVARVVKLAQTRRERNIALRLVLFLATMALTAVLGLLYSETNDVVRSIISVQVFILSAVAFACFLFAAAASMALVQDLQEVLKFCASLNSLCEWSGNNLENFTYRNEEYIKEVARLVLVAKAKEELLLKLGETQESRLDSKRIGGEIIAELGRRYDTLSRIGLASGGYAKYFEDARHEIEMKKREAEK